jgi:AraC-like DNA-binding protein
VVSDSILSSIITCISEIYANCNIHRSNVTRRDEICKELIQLVTQYYATERKAQFYADKMGVSLQYLSTTVKQVTGKNILDIISYVVIMDAKSKLKSTNMTIQEISYSLNFPNASFFGKYFKRHVGMTPLEFRES